LRSVPREQLPVAHRFDDSRLLRRQLRRGQLRIQLI